MAQPLFFGIDVGTTKIVALSGRVDRRRGWVEVDSVGEAESRGLKRGVVVDRELATESITRAVEACGITGERVVVGIAGSHISSSNIEVTLLNRGRDFVISRRFLKKIEREVSRVDLGGHEEVLHVIPRRYLLDDGEVVAEPLGRTSRKVTIEAHVVTGSVQNVQDLMSSVEESEMKISEIVLEPLASAEACLTEVDRNEGVALLDIGGGTTDLSVFKNGALAHTAVVPVGGESLTADVAYGLKISFEQAEALKIRYGTAVSDIVDSVAAVRLGDRHYSARFMAEILESRAREILDYTRDSLHSADLHGSISSLVLTGGGSQLEGMVELAEGVLGLPARTASPRLLRGKSKPVRKPQYSTAVGLLYFTAQNNNLVSKSKGAADFSFGSIAEAVRGWFRRK